MSEVRNVPTQQMIKFSLTTTESGKIDLKIFDRIIVDDVIVHLINQEVYRIITNKDPGTTIARSFKDFLVKERYRAR